MAPTPAFYISHFSAPRVLHSFPTRRSSDLLGDQHHGDHDALAHAARNLVRIKLCDALGIGRHGPADRKSTRLNSSHVKISYAVFCLKKKNTKDSVTGADRNRNKQIVLNIAP